MPFSDTDQKLPKCNTDVVSISTCLFFVSFSKYFLSGKSLIFFKTWCHKGHNNLQVFDSKVRKKLWNFVCNVTEKSKLPNNLTNFFFENGFHHKPLFLESMTQVAYDKNYTFASLSFSRVFRRPLSFLWPSKSFLVWLIMCSFSGLELQPFLLACKESIMLLGFAEGGGRRR